MPPGDFCTIIDRISSLFTAVTFVRTGEPLVNDGILDMIAKARASGLIVTLNSNLATLDRDFIRALLQAGPHRITTTLISADAEGYNSKQVGASFDQTVSNITEICHGRQEAGRAFPIVEVQLIANQRSVRQVDEFARIVERIGCDIAYVKPMRVDLLRHDDEYRRILVDDLPLGHQVCNYEAGPSGELRLKYPGPCPQNDYIFVSVDGDVFPCLFAPGHIEAYGNLLEQSFEEVWNGCGLAQDKKSLFLRRGHLICRACVPSREISLRVR